LLSISEQEGDGFNYVLGYIASKKNFRIKYAGLLGNKTNSIETDDRIPCFVRQISSGGLSVPTSYWKKIGTMLEKLFLKHHGKMDFRKKTNVVHRLYRICIKNKKIKESDIPEDVVKAFVKMRTIVRLRYTNLHYLKGNITNPETVGAIIGRRGVKRKATSTSTRRQKKTRKLVN
jgi:hypothetical protein